MASQPIASPGRPALLVFDPSDPDALAALADALAGPLAARLGDLLAKPGLTPDSVLDAKEAVEYLRLSSVNALHKLSAAGQITSLQREAGGKLRFRKRDLDAWLEGSNP